MTGTDLCVNKPHSVPVIFEPPCNSWPGKIIKHCLNYLTSSACYPIHAGFLRGMFFDPEDRGDRCSLTFNGLRGVISQKIELFIATAVRTSDPTIIPVVLYGCKMLFLLPREDHIFLYLKRK
jgi:hypothetical protein